MADLDNTDNTVSVGNDDDECIVEEDTLLEAALVYVTDKTYPEEADSNKRRVIRKKAQKFSMENGEVKYTKRRGK